MPYLASRRSPEADQPPNPVTGYRSLVFAVVSVVFAIAALSVCVLTVTAA